MSHFIHFIADYGRGDPAFSEVTHRLRAELPEATVQPTAVPPLSTVSTGFWIEQLGRHNPPFNELIVYSNTAPRTTNGDQSRPSANRLCALRLDTGVRVVAVDAGHNLSFVKPHIQDFRLVSTPTTSNQFRSRDLFPARVAQLARGDDSVLAERMDADAVPDRPPNVVCHVDGYGNVKTSLRASEFDTERDAVEISINDASALATVADSVDDATPGALAILPGSSGGNDAYMELFVRGGSAAATLDNPEPGDHIELP